MKILIADTFEEVGVRELERLGHAIVARPGATADELPALLREVEPDVLVVRGTPVRGEALRAGRRLKLVVRAGAGYDTIDVAAASAEGVAVANCPGKNAIAVAEVTWALILACDRRVPDQTVELRAGRWNKQEFSAARGLYGRTLGVLGLGAIGRAVAERGRGFGMEVVAWSRSLDDERARALGVARAASVLDVARRADVLTIHVASTGATKHLVNADVIDALRPGAILINTSRGALLDEDAARRAVVDRGLRVGLDVFEGEPKGGAASFDSAIARTPGVYTTHHVGASTDQAQTAIAMEAVRIIAVFATSGDVVHCVNRAATSTATCLLTVRHRNRPGVLARVFDVISAARLNVEEMENVIYEGAEAACARIQLSAAPTAADLERIAGSCPEILSVDLTSLAGAGERRRAP